MKKPEIRLLLNPFERIAGTGALLWGLAGMVVSTVLSVLSGWHYHGLLHFGPAPNPAWWCFAAEHLAVWLVPAVLFYIGGLLLSRSSIRIIDVLGTVAFAQLPLILMNLLNCLPQMRYMLTLNGNQSPVQMLEDPNILLGIWLSLVSLIFVVWMLAWMFQALKVSCNLKGYRLGILYCVGAFGGDVLCRYLIGVLY